ncbi:MAG: permease [Myxococcales bacterium]|nr:permease [Myxococcales bacterium]
MIAAVVLLVTLVAQAVVPRARLLIVLSGAAVSLLSCVISGTADTRTLFADVPWDVLVIVVALGLLSEYLASSRVFGLLALHATRASAADPVRVLILFCTGMYCVSGLVNNITALLLVLPVMLALLKLIGVDQRYVSWTLGATLVACNLGGAATPTGDFPAILLLGRGAMTFTDYLSSALPQTAVALVLMLVVVLAIRPARDLEREGLGSRLALRIMEQLYRNTTLDRRRFLPGIASLVLMFGCWSLLPASTGVGPELIAGVGCLLALVSTPLWSERLLRTRVDVEAVLFLLALFLMVGAVRASGAFVALGDQLTALPLSDRGQVIVFFCVVAVSTGLFSAGPGMAAFLDVAERLAARHDPATIYVGLAMSVCAGSSLFLTAATSGPMAQVLTERASIIGIGGETIRFGFLQHMRPGLLGFAITLATGIAFAWPRLG